MRTLLLILVLGVSSCATLKTRCEKTDWNQFGENKGAAGSDWHSDPFPNQCTETGVRPDLAAIEAGFRAGLAKFCVEDGFRISALNGEVPSPALCPVDLQKKLKAAIEAGLKSHCTKQGAFNRGKSGKENLHVCPQKLQAQYDRYFSQGKASFYKVEIAKRHTRVYEISSREAILLKEQEELIKKNGNPPKEFWAKQSFENNAEELKKLMAEKEKIEKELPELQAKESVADADGVTVESGSLE